MHLKQASLLSKGWGEPHQTKVQFGWYIRTRFAYAAKFGLISEPTLYTNELYAIAHRRT
jgi:hypothetical protein